MNIWPLSEPKIENLEGNMSYMERLLTVEQVAAILQVAVATIYKWVSAKQIPYAKISHRAVRFEEYKIKEWIEEKTHKVGDENEQNIRRNRKRNKVGRTRCNEIGNLIERTKREVLNNKGGHKK